MPSSARWAAILTGALAVTTPMGLLAGEPAPVGGGIYIGPLADNIGGRPCIAFDGTNFVAVWGAAAPFATRIATDGTVLEPAAIPLGASGSAVPAVAFDGTNYLAIWVNGTDILGARMDPDGNVLDDPPLALATDARPRPISLAFDGTNYLMVWRTNGDLIHGARISTAGQNLDDAAGFLIGSGFYPWVAYGDGQFLVVWHWHGNGLDIFGARIATDGTVIEPGVFVISDAAEDQDHSSVASDGTDFFVAWNDRRGGDDTNTGSVYGTRVSAAGAVLDAPALQVGPYAWYQTPAVAVFDGTDYLVVWHSGLNANYRLNDAFGRRVANDGTFVDPTPFSVGASYSHQWAPTVGYGDGLYLSAWTERSHRCASDACSWGRLFQKPDPAPRSPISAAGRTPPPGPTGLEPPLLWTAESAPGGDDLMAIHGLGRHSMYIASGGARGDLLYRGVGGWSIVATSPLRLFGLWANAADDIMALGQCWASFQFDGVVWDGPNCNGVGGANDPFQFAFGAWGDGDSFWGVGTGGTFQFHDGGWQMQAMGTERDLFDLWGAAGDDLWAVGELGTVLRHDGTDWTPVAGVPTGQGLNTIWGSGPGDVFIAGDFGTIVHYDGNAWSVMASGTTEHLFALAGAGPNEVYAVGANGTILRYDGVGWNLEGSGTPRNLFDVVVGDDVWAVGGQGTILLRSLFFDGFEGP